MQNFIYFAKDKFSLNVITELRRYEIVRLIRYPIIKAIFTCSSKDKIHANIIPLKAFMQPIKINLKNSEEKNIVLIF